jgi:hypothetical protein
MYMGICPGNIGSMNYLDVYRRESQRDFADGSGVLSRAIIEGLFGIQPDLLSQELIFNPGLPKDWKHASIEHPDFDIIFERNGINDRYTIRSRLSKKAKLKVRIPAIYKNAKVYVNGQRKSALINTESILPMLTFESPPSEIWEIIVEWKGGKIEFQENKMSWPGTEDVDIPGISGVDWSTPIPTKHKLEPVNLTDVFNDKVSSIFESGKYRSPRSPGVSLAIPAQGIGSWAGHYKEIAEIDDSGLRSLGGTLKMPNGVYFYTPPDENTQNVVFVSQWDNYPNKITIPLSGKAHKVFLLMAGSTYHMQSQKENATIVVQYSDGITTELPLVNPTNWWPIDQDFFIDDYQFHRPGPLPPRVDLKTGKVRLLNRETFVGTGGKVDGGAATVLALTLNPKKKLKSISLEAVANEVVIGLLSATLER